ncbi:MAG: hypothetical protein Q8P21_01825 [bacterium]|nr:hypothetical protein [bacterium]
MTRFRLVFALSIATLLIGWASWVRFVPSEKYSQDLVLVKDLEQNYLPNNTLSEDFLATSTPSGGSAGPLSQTDLVSRQLFSEYVGLASQNRVTPNNINALAEKYASGILSLETSPETINRSEIVVVPDSKNSLIAYSKAVTEMHAKYESLASVSRGQSSLTDINDHKFKELMVYVSKLYEQAAADLIKLPVPNSLADNHISLINNYLSSSGATKILANVAEDPVGAYAALTTHARNSDEETGLLLNIQVAVAINSTVSGNGI